MNCLRCATRAFAGAVAIASLLGTGLAACSSEASSDADDATTTTTIDAADGDVDAAVLELDGDREMFHDPSQPVVVSVGDDFGLLLPRPDDDIRWVLSPRPDLGTVLTMRTSFLEDDTTLGADEPGAVLFRFKALGPGTLDLSFKEVKGTFGEEVPDAEVITFSTTVEE